MKICKYCNESDSSKFYPKRLMCKKCKYILYGKGVKDKYAREYSLIAHYRETDKQLGLTIELTLAELKLMVRGKSCACGSTHYAGLKKINKNKVYSVSNTILICMSCRIKKGK